MNAVDESNLDSARDIILPSDIHDESSILQSKRKKKKKKKKKNESTLVGTLDSKIKSTLKPPRSPHYTSKSQEGSKEKIESIHIEPVKQETV